MSADHLHFEWWLDEDGWIWVRHDCNGTPDEWHPPNSAGRSWALNESGGIHPSFHCTVCGRHVVLSAADRKPA